ncbi:MAG: TetR/AcrR family transcriptional regulator [Phycisphaerales bacterium JB043]
MQSLARQPRSDSRSAILDAACAELASNPRASLSLIAERAGVGRATLHRHFRTREDLIRELAQQSIREIDEAVAGLEDQARSALHFLELVVEAVIPFGDRYHFLANETWAATDPTLSAELDRQLSSLGELIEICKSEGAIDASIPTPWIVSAIDSLIYTAWSLVATGHIAQRGASSLLMRTLLKGVQP